MYWRLAGVDNYEEFEHGDPRNPDPNFDLDRYISDNSQTWLWNPDTATTKVLLPSESGTLLTDGSGRTLVVCEPTSGHEPEPGDELPHGTANVYSMPEGKFTRSITAEIAYHLSGEYYVMHLRPQPVFGGAAGEGVFFAKGTTEGPAVRGNRQTGPWDALALVGLDGSVRFLSDGTNNRFLSYLPGLPAVVTLEDGQPAVGCMLETWGAVPWRLALFGMDGQRIREYSFGLRYGAVEKVTGRKTIWQPITVTPDGRYLLLQDTGLRGGLTRGQDGWVWMWNLEERTGRPLARLRGISAVYGWVHDEYLLVQLEAATGGDIADQGPLYVPWQTTHVQAVPPEQSRPEE